MTPARATGHYHRKALQALGLQRTPLPREIRDMNAYRSAGWDVPDIAPDDFYLAQDWAREGFNAAVWSAPMQDCPHPRRTSARKAWLYGWAKAHYIKALLNEVGVEDRFQPPRYRFWTPASHGIERNSLPFDQLPHAPA